MKRSSTLGLVVMGAAAFTASFAGGSAFLAWKSPSQAQNCTTRPDGTQACTPTRTPAGVARAVHVAVFPDRAAASTPVAADRPVSARASVAPAGPVPERTTRRGFGASAKAAFRGSAGG